jgi:NADH dehydrogenase
MVLRNHVLDTFEHADVEEDAQERRQMLTFVVIGGGYTGIEIAAELNEFVQSNRRFYKNVHQDEVKVIVIDPGPRIMHEINESLATYAMSLLRKRGMEFHLQTRVSSVTPDAVVLEGGANIPTNTAIWAAGTAPQPVIETLPCEKKRGKIVVNEYLEVPGWPGVWAVGDCAHILDPKTGGAYPPTAQHAVREGRQAAHNIAATIRGKDQEKRPFQFSTLGMLAPLGHRRAVAEIKGFKLSGFSAWFLWRGIYLGKLPGWDRKIRVALDWALDLFLPRDIVQLPFIMKKSSPQIQTKDTKEGSYPK